MASSTEPVNWDKDSAKDQSAIDMNTTKTDNQDNNNDDDSDPEDNDNDLTNESSSLMISSHVPIPRVRPWGQQMMMMHSDNNTSSSKRLSVHQRRSVRKSLKSSLHNSGSDHRSLFSSMSSMASAGSTSGIFDLEEDEDGNITAISPNSSSNKRGTLARQESWYQDLVAQGMTDADIAALLGGEDEDAEENDMTPVNTITNDEAQSPANEQHIDNIPTNTLDEQTIARQAQALAKQQVLERLGYDPWERAQHKEVPQTQNNTSSSSISSSSSLRFPPTRKVPPRPPPLPPSQPTELFAWNPQPWIDNEPSRAMTTTSDLVVGEPIATKDNDNSTNNSPTMSKIPVVCWGCGQAHDVPLMATLMRCPQCQTVSPASSSTTTARSTSSIPCQT